MVILQQSSRSTTTPSETVLRPPSREAENVLGRRRFSPAAEDTTGEYGCGLPVVAAPRLPGAEDLLLKHIRQALAQTRVAATPRRTAREITTSGEEVVEAEGSADVSSGSLCIVCNKDKHSCQIILNKERPEISYLPTKRST